MLRIETIGVHIYKVHVHVRPFNNLKDVLSMFPFSYGRCFEANFNIKDGAHNSAIRWGGIMGELMKVAKFHKTYIYNPSLFSDYKVVVENKIFWGNLRYKISLDTSYHVNGVKGKITITTGQPSSEWGGTYLACEREIENLIRHMYNDIGLTETEKHCREYSRFADVE